MKKLIILFIIFLTFFGISFAQENNQKVKIYFDIFDKDIDDNYYEILYGDTNDLQNKFLKFHNKLREVSNVSVIKFYNKLIKIDLKFGKYKKNKDLINIIKYATIKKIISTNVEKEYIFLEKDLEWYKNEKLGFEFMYPKKYEDGNERQIIEKDNLIFIPYSKEINENFQIDMKDKDNYSLFRKYDFAFIVKDNIKNDEDISNFLNDIFGEGCKNFEKIESKRESFKNDFKYIKIKNLGVMGEDVTCKYVYHEIYYSPEEKKIITWGDYPYDDKFNHLNMKNIYNSIKLIKD